jgi:alkylated DNA repair protein alkB family protein 6
MEVVLSDEHRVSQLQRVWVLTEYVSTDEEAALLAACTGPAARWTQVSGRRLQALGGTVHAAAGLLPAPLPKWVNPLLVRIQRTAGSLFGDEPLNHVLVNCYAAGEGILAHQDGPLYFPAVAIVSLGADAVMQFSPHQQLRDSSAETVSVWLPRRSLLVFTDEAYSAYLHGIPGREVDDLAAVCNAPAGGATEATRVGTRVSLTCRRVLKVRRNLLPTRP